MEAGKNLLSATALFMAHRRDVVRKRPGGRSFRRGNSEALPVFEGTGLHACEYMTNGTVIILGRVSHNVGAGMTGGKIYLRAEYADFINSSYLTACKPGAEDIEFLRSSLADFLEETGSSTARHFLDNWQNEARGFFVLLPKNSPEALAARESKVA